MPAPSIVARSSSRAAFKPTAKAALPKPIVSQVRSLCRTRAGRPLFQSSKRHIIGDESNQGRNCTTNATACTCQLSFSGPLGWILRTCHITPTVAVGGHWSLLCYEPFWDSPSEMRSFFHAVRSGKAHPLAITLLLPASLHTLSLLISTSASI